MALLKVGDAAPEFCLQGTDGLEHRLQDFRGEKLVLYFYPKDSTPGCTQESCDFRDYKNVIEATEAKIVGVSADSIESHEKFISKHDLNFLLLSDPSKAMLSAYGVLKENGGIARTTYIVDANGKIAKVYPQVSVAGHVEDIIADLPLIKD